MWFYLTSSRHPSCNLSMFSVEICDESNQFSKEFMALKSSVKVGKNCKPSQIGVLILTQLMIEMQSYFVACKGYKFILTSIFFQVYLYFILYKVSIYF